MLVFLVATKNALLLFLYHQYNVHRKLAGFAFPTEIFRDIQREIDFC